MKIIQIIHNPTAGNASYSKQALIDFFKGSGNVIKYVSTDDDGWENFPVRQTDLIFLAGGDGTVRKLVEILIRNRKPNKNLPPVKLFPLGTANNIAETLKIPADSNIRKIDQEGDRKNFDCGSVKGLKDQEFFLESVGFGIFPELISKTEENKIEEEDPDEEIREVLDTLLEIVKDYKARKAKIKIDDITIKGSFLLVELMNIKFLGPNLKIAPGADPGDCYLDLIMIPEKNRPELISYLKKMIRNEHKNIDTAKFVKTIRIKKIKMKWEGSKVHVDDSLIKDYSGKILKMKVVPAVFQFLK